jgi:hypothetical protein
MWSLSTCTETGMGRQLCQWLMLIVLQALIMNSACALEIETLVMPDKVIAGHAKFESECSSCHTAFSRDQQNALCVDCHEDIGADIKAVKGYHGLTSEAKNSECASCHTEHIGRDANIIPFDADAFDHSFTDFELLGKHVEVICKDCHEPDATYREAPSVCIDCHLEDDVHKGGLGEECASCHGPKGWDLVEFKHEKETGFALAGGHAAVLCGDCHVEQKFTETEAECIACHRADDVHEGRRGDDCASCHTVVNWKDSGFDHAIKTNFPLLGEHAGVACESCHVDDNFEIELQTTCIACHLKDDSHKGLLGEACADCHDEVSWTESRFRHDTFTEFPLLGGHAVLECQLCHAVPVNEANPGTDCYSCHVDDDPHKGQLGEACADCHNETDWTQNVRFDHDFTPFPLTGLHKKAECKVCHETSQFKDASVECVDCHRDEDVHKGGLGSDCGSCHSPVGWERWRFDHYIASGVALDGAHAELTCAECHRKPPKQGGAKASRCIDCHRQDDVHNGQLGKDCARCHSTTTFLGAEELP